MKILRTISDLVFGKKTASPPTATEPTQAAIAPEQSQNGNAVEPIKQVESNLQVDAEAPVDQSNQPVDQVESLAEGESTEQTGSTETVEATELESPIESPEISADSEVQTEQLQTQEPPAETVAPQAEGEETIEIHKPEAAAEVEAQDDSSSIETVEPPQVVAEVSDEEQPVEPKPRIRILGEPGASVGETTDDVRGEPQRAGLLPASYLSYGANLFQCKGEDRRPGDCDVLMLQSVYLEINKHLSEDRSREYGGLLLGLEIQSSDPDTFSILITNALRAPHTDGTSSRLTFTQDTWAALGTHTDELKKLGMKLRRLGWYHSHPNHGVFLSGYDLNVCADFTRQTQVALVVDPIRNEGGFFVHGRRGYRSHCEQGFWELQDLKPESIVTWKNVRRVVNSLDGPRPFPHSDEGEHFGSNNWTAGGIGGAELIEDSPIIRRAVHIDDDEDQPLIRVQNAQTRDRSNMPPWVFLLVAVLLPTMLAILALRSLSNLHQEILAMEESITTLTLNLSNLETKVKEAAAARTADEPSSLPSQSGITSGAGVSSRVDETPGRTRETSSRANTNAQTRRASNTNRNTNTAPATGKKAGQDRPAQGTPSPKPSSSN